MENYSKKMKILHGLYDLFGKEYLPLHEQSRSIEYAEQRK
jgi:hypothetical protein